MSKKITEMGFQKVKKVLHGVTIYNIDKDLRDKLVNQYLNEIIRNINDDSAEIEIDDRQMLLAYLPQLTDIDFDLVDELQILNIIDNPNEELEDIINEIKPMLIKILEHTMVIFKEFLKTNFEITKDMTDEEKEQYYKKYFNTAEQIEEELTEEEKLIIEKAKKLGKI